MLLAKKSNWMMSKKASSFLPLMKFWTSSLFLNNFIEGCIIQIKLIQLHSAERHFKNLKIAKTGK